MTGLFNKCIILRNVDLYKTWWFVLFQCAEHGFPHKPSALAYDKKLKLLAIGTKTGALKMYPFEKDKIDV